MFPSILNISLCFVTILNKYMDDEVSCVKYENIVE